MPPDSGNAEASSAKLSAVSAAMTPLSAKATIAPGPVAANATPASARIPPPTMAPTPTPVAPQSPIERSMPPFSRIRLVALRQRYREPPTLPRNASNGSTDVRLEPDRRGLAGERL